MKLIMENWKRYLKESRFKGFERELKNRVFPHLPDFVFNDMYGHEGVKDYAVERTDDINRIGLEKFFKTDEFAKSVYDRYNLQWTKKPVVLELNWEDIGKEERDFLMKKHLGLNPNFPMDKYREKIQRIVDTIPGLGQGDHEPVIFKMEGNSVVDVLGGRHRTFAAFLKNSETDSEGKIKFNPTKIKAYVGKA